jgi:hypothetical protein
VLTLTSAGLTVDLLDPSAHRPRLGHRYCWGGYIWQVTDRSAGPLLAGPEWPEPEPDAFNGQGLPEAFRHRDTTGAPLLWRGEAGLAPGAGLLGRDAAGATIVTEPCAWEIEYRSESLRFATTQSALGWSYRLVRTIELQDRRLISRTLYTNLGEEPLVHEWFAHPFFALGRDGRSTLLLPEGTALDDNPGYALSGRQLTFKRAFSGKDDGHLERPRLPPGTPLVAEISHPRLRHLRFTTSFAPSHCVLWANGNTVSLEPFLQLALSPGETREWSLTYDFINL